MQLTNTQIERAIPALAQWNPECSFKTKLRLSRNLRKLTAAQGDKNSVREKLMLSCVKDKSRKPEANGFQLTVDEHAEFMEKYKELMETVVEVDVHPIEICDSSEALGAKPKDPDTAIDLGKIAVPNEILERLLDVVLVPVGQE